MFENLTPTELDALAEKMASGYAKLSKLRRFMLDASGYVGPDTANYSPAARRISRTMTDVNSLYVMATATAWTLRHPAGHAAQYRTHAGGYLVYCPAGCKLGTSAIVGTTREAAKRIELHRIATQDA